MKKRLINLILIASMVMTMASCGSDDANQDATQDAVQEQNVIEAVSDEVRDVLVIGINGKEYDLSRDFKAVVGQMVQDGLCAYNDMYLMEYNPNGEMVEAVASEAERPIISVYQMRQAAEVSPIVRCKYDLKYLDDFTTVDGINGESVADNVGTLEGYMIYGSEEYMEAVAMYIDGRRVNLEAYRDIYEEWLNEIIVENNADGAYTEYLSTARYYINNFVMNETIMRDNDAVKEKMNETGFEQQMLLTFAAMDAGQKAENGEINSYDIITYLYRTESGANVSYLHYYADEEFTNYDKSLRD